MNIQCEDWIACSFTTIHVACSRSNQRDLRWLFIRHFSGNLVQFVVAWGIIRQVYVRCFDNVGEINNDWTRWCQKSFDPLVSKLFASWLTCDSMVWRTGNRFRDFPLILYRKVCDILKLPSETEFRTGMELFSTLQLILGYFSHVCYLRNKNQSNFVASTANSRQIACKDRNCCYESS